jgi:hypothetical protein
MACGASASALEVPFASLGVSGLEVRGIYTFSSANAPASADARERNVLLGMNKGYQAGNLLIGTIKGRHAPVGPPIAYDGSDFVSIHVRRYQL